MQRVWIFVSAFITIRRPEPARERVHQSGAEVVEAPCADVWFLCAKVGVVGAT